MKIISLSEGSFTVDKTKQFIPFDSNEDNLQDRNSGSLLVEIQPFVIITSKDILLLDTGLGFADAEGILQLHKNLKKNNINPEDVSKVLISHLHKDHSGGISHLVKGERVLSFTNAAYYINKKEFDSAFENSKSSYNIEDFALLKHSSKLKLIEGSGIIDDYITYEITGGHSEYHQVFWIAEDEQKVFFGGDVVPQLQQLRNKFIAKYDFDGRKSMQLRENWKVLGSLEKWTFLFYHDIKTPMFQY